MVLSFLVFLSVVVVMLVNIPIFTLFERKILSYIQNRKGPKKVSFLGLLQPVADGMKLLGKNLMTPLLSNFNMFIWSPLLSFLLMCSGWYFFSLSSFKSVIFNLSILMFLCVSSMKIFGLLGSGWGSKSKYALMGSLRGCIQVMSYEMGFLTMILIPCCLNSSWGFIWFFQKNIWLVCVLLMVFVMFFLSIVAETNRAPFDFAEGESELVSGFNIEYGSFSFALLFLAEYGSIILVSMISSLLFFFSKFSLAVFFMGNFFCFMFLVLRGSFPRWRIDMLSKFGWKVVLPLSFSYAFLMFVVL